MPVNYSNTGAPPIGGGESAGAQSTTPIKSPPATLDSLHLTVWGYLITQHQFDWANLIVKMGKQLQAPGIAIVACVFAASCESTLGVDMGWNARNPTYGGLLAGDRANFSQFGSANSSAVAQQEILSFFQGGRGFHPDPGGAISNAHNYTDPGKLAAFTEGCYVFGSSLGPNGYGQYEGELARNGTSVAQVISESIRIVKAIDSGVVPGGVAGAGGTGTSTNSAPSAPFTLGTSQNPNEDVWTCVNRLAQARQWYIFSDGSDIYLADGTDLLSQSPVLTVDRWGDSDKIIHLDFTWDNTAFQFTSNRKRAPHRVQRKSTLQKVASPVSANLSIICDIDAVRAGDVVALSGCGPGDGKWLVGDCTRSVFKIYSEMTLIPPMAALNEAEAAGAGVLPKSGASSSTPGAGTVIRGMIDAANKINNANLAYVWGGGHAVAGTPSVGAVGQNGNTGTLSGYDCSGAVGAVLHGGGLLNGGVPSADASQFIAVLPKGALLPGQGSGTPECTIWFAGYHTFMRLNGKYFGTSDGYGGVGNATQHGGPGGAWLTAGPDINNPSFVPYHIPQNILGSPINSQAR